MPPRWVTVTFLVLLVLSVTLLVYFNLTLN